MHQYAESIRNIFGPQPCAPEVSVTLSPWRVGCHGVTQLHWSSATIAQPMATLRGFSVAVGAVAFGICLFFSFMFVVFVLLVYAFKGAGVVEHGGFWMFFSSFFMTCLGRKTGRKTYMTRFVSFFFNFSVNMTIGYLCRWKGQQRSSTSIWMWPLNVSFFDACNYYISSMMYS